MRGSPTTPTAMASTPSSAPAVSAAARSGPASQETGIFKWHGLDATVPEAAHARACLVGPQQQWQQVICAAGLPVHSRQHAAFAHGRRHLQRAGMLPSLHTS